MLSAVLCDHILMSHYNCRFPSKNHRSLLSFGKCYHFGLAQSDHIKRLLLYLYRFQQSVLTLPTDCPAKCSEKCVDGLEFCFGQMTFWDMPSNRLDMTDTSLYLYCSCWKSKLIRAPGT